MLQHSISMEAAAAIGRCDCGAVRGTVGHV